MWMLLLDLLVKHTRLTRILLDSGIGLVAEVTNWVKLAYCKSNTVLNVIIIYFFAPFVVTIVVP